ncbi:hypothetical protein GX563_00285 [Candidatus Bathyarchaeota archaeon]|nr:hypothetical protein [Candidatus Bathyarchaeota archaeon]
MKRLKVLGLAILLVIIIGATLVIINANSTQTNQDDQQAVKITNFSMVDKQWFYLGGLTFSCNFNLTIENNGVSNITGLELKVKLFSNGNEVQVGNYFDNADENGTITEPLHVGEVRSCNGTILCNVGDRAYGTNLTSNQTTVVAQVILNGNILDEKRSQ